MYAYDHATKRSTAASIASLPKQEEGISVRREKEPEPPNAMVWADIKGAVVHPGVYSLASGQRVDQLIRAAGGLSPEANDEAINMAKVVGDGEMIYIPRKGEPAQAIPMVMAGTSREGTTKVVHVNSATQEELNSLPGIGDAKARAIFQYRSVHGPFRAKEDLKKVNGIGERLYERIVDSITIE